MNSIHFLTYLAARCITGILNLLPYPVVQALGRTAGTLVYYCHQSRRAIALDNLRSALGDMYPESELKRIARQSCVNLVLVFLEFIRVPEMVKDFPRYVTLVRGEMVWNELKKGHGVILLVSHYGNWELMAIMAGIVKYPISAVGRPMKNPYIYNYIKRIREYTGLRSLEKKGTARQVMKELKENGVVAILFDQYAGSSGTVVPFFGRTAYTTPVVAQLALHTGASVLPAYNTRNNDGTHTIYVDDPIPLINTGDKEKDIVKNTENYNRNLEKWIKKNPHLWFWFHKRWKTPRPQIRG